MPVKALVTGAAGFVGHHMVAELLNRGYDVHSVDLLPMEVMVDFRRPAHLHIVQDALDYFRTSTWQFDLVVHAAAAEPHRAAIDSRPMNLATNLMLDAAMFDWAVRTEQRRVLYLSSSAAYPVRLQTEEFRQRCGGRIRPLVEDDITHHQWSKTGDWSPDANYGWAKLTGERIAQAARESGLPVTVVRPASGCGADQSENFPFVAIAKRVAAKENPLVIWGPVEQVRDWIDISDLVSAALAVVDSGTEDPVNLCTGLGTSMGDLAALMWREMHGNLDGLHLVSDLSKPTGVMYRVLDPARMLKYYTPKVTLQEMISNAARASSA